MSDDLELLITRYLEGAASAEEVAQLDRMSVSDPSVREALLQAARQSGDVKDILQKLEGKTQRPSAPGRRFPAVPLMAAAAFVALLAGVLLVTRPPAASPSKPPAAGAAPAELKGWQIRSGKWSLLDGVLTGESTESSPARIETEAEY